MLHNPYVTPEDPNQRAALRFQTYLSGEDKALLMSIRPVRGTAQAVINTLIKNLCDELRELNITSFHPDADDIFGILVEPRELTNGQFERLRCTTAGTIAKVPKGLREHRGGSKVRKRAANPKTRANNPKSKTVGGE